MKIIIAIIISLLFFHSGYCQIYADTIDERDVERIIRFLASDNLKGRGNSSPQLKTAADFISSEFLTNGLKNYPGYSTFFQPFNIGALTKKERNDTSLLYKSNKVLINVVGVLEGKILPDEAIIFCAHYDHLGIKYSGSKDKIFNGANDNASGTTAMLTLAKYFSQRNDNARTLIFCAFAGEELGLMGSNTFVNNIQPENIVAVINIEMIGVSSFNRKKTFFITGSDYSDVSSIFKKNLNYSGFNIIADPMLSKHLFERSDNYPFALKGIPAHTIMGSDDDDTCYHRPCDEVQRLDIENMTQIIKAIVIGSKSLVMANDYPTRIDFQKIK